MDTSTATTAGTAEGGRWKPRLMAVAAAVLAALAIWAVADLALGVDLREPSFAGPESTGDIGAANVVIASAIASLAGWGLLAVLERMTARARTVWAVIATLVTVASLGAPLTGAGVTAANRVVLVLLHLVVGAVLIPLLYRTSRSRRPSG